MTNVLIRPAAPIEARHINEVVALGSAETYRNPELGFDDAWCERLMREMLTDESVMKCSTQISVAKLVPDYRLYLVATDDQGIAGALSAITPREGGLEREIDRLYVARDRRSQGIGSALLARYFEWVPEGVPTDVSVVSYNTSAQRFYRRHGFRKVRGSAAEYNRIPTITMRHQGKETV